MAAAGQDAGKGPQQSMSAPGGERLIGKVRSFQGQWGFITSDLVEGDIFVHVRDVPLGEGDILRPGEAVEFELQAGKGGNQAKAANVRRAGASSEGDGIKMDGVFVSFRNGWGLIESPMLEGKLYCGLKDNPKLEQIEPCPGDAVLFELGQNPKDGRQKAMNVTFVPKPQNELVGKRTRGIIKSMKNGWGFAMSPRFEGNIMVGHKNLMASGLPPGSVNPGDTVDFEIAPGGGDGRFEAVNIRKLIGGPVMQQLARPGFGGAPQAPVNYAHQPPPPRTPPPAYTVAAFNGFGRQQQRVRGQVRNFNTAGWGFAESPQFQDTILLGKRALTASGLAGQTLQPGQMVEFEVVPGSSPGKLEANNISLVGFGKGAQMWQQQGPMQMQMQGPCGGGMGGCGGARDRSRSPFGNHGAMGQRVQGQVIQIQGEYAFAHADGVEGRVLLGTKNLIASGLRASTLAVHEWLTFDMAAGNKGYEAQNIQRLGVT